MRKLLPFVLALGLGSAFGQGQKREPLLQPNDVVALVGGEEMVVLAERGEMEAYVLTAIPEAKIKFRCLAWEGDTVFAQPREVNYPTLEQQLDEIGATVVLAQFGQAESLDLRRTGDEFTGAYERLIDRLQGPDAKRRVVLIEPLPIMTTYADSTRKRYSISEARFAGLIYKICERRSLVRIVTNGLSSPIWTSRDGVHLDSGRQIVFGGVVASRLVGIRSMQSTATEGLSEIVAAKHRLWERYRRPQNWAFLAGDRVTQPSSRDHRDPSKRWFPEEMKAYLPLIEAKEQAAWTLAAGKPESPQ